MADSRVANRMSQARTTSLPAPRTAPDLAMVIRWLALRWWNGSAIDGSPTNFVASTRYGVDPGHVHVRDEIVRVTASEHEHLDGVLGLGSLNEEDQIPDQLGAEKIHRTVPDFHEPNCVFRAHVERVESGRGHL